MQRTSRPEGLDLPPPQLQRNHSLSGDRTPSISGTSLLSPPSVSPDPAYIAASAAAQIVSSDHADLSPESIEGEEQEAEEETAIVSPGSLVLVNSFLDQLLYSFLASARSTSIASLRPAILEVLKPRLGKEAIDGADEELQGYLAGGDAEELLAFHSGQEFKGEYNLNLIWRRTRLRCMVYTRLGDMEEDDEEMHLVQEHEMDANDGRPRLNRDLGSVSPAAAIFLTSILEFIGEQALLVAGEAAYHRLQIKQPPSEDQRVVVEEVDMEKLAFNTTLGRLWRSWKKRVRTSSLLSPRPMSRDTQRNKASSLSGGDSTNRKSSISEEDESGYFDPARRPSVAAVLHRDQALIPVQRENIGDLPEEPDFSDFAPNAPAQSRTNKNRPRSMIEYQYMTSDPSTYNPIQTVVLNGEETAGAATRPAQKRQRSSSVPAKQTPYVSPVEETFTTPSEGPDPFVRNIDRADAEKDMPKLTDDAKTVPGLTNGNPAVSTMYDGAISQGHEALPQTMAERNDRGISTYTESSNYTDEYDHDLAPQALNLIKPTDVSTDPRESRTSTISSSYSLQAGDLNPAAHPRGLSQNLARKETESEGDAYPRRSDSSEGDRQHVGNFANLATLQEHQLRTYDESGKAVKRDIPVLYEAPSNADVIYNPDASVRTSTGPQDEGEVSTPTRPEYQVGGHEHGVPPLTPLQELMDAAHDTSDEASSSAMSYEVTKPDVFVPTHRYQGSDGLRNGSYSSSHIRNSQSMNSARKSVDSRSQPLAVNTGTERAAVQRVSPSSATSFTPNGRTSTSSNRDGRPMTAGSSTSQMSSKIKGMIGRESGDLIRQPMPKRNSSDGSGSLLRTPNREQDFEELIRSDETVKYTLTPQSMREMETPESPRWQAHSRSGTAELADSLRSSAPTGADSERPATSRSVTKLKGLNGLRSNPTNGSSPTTSTHGRTSSIENVRAQPKPIAKSPGPRSPGVVAREATAKDDPSLRDFSDFIRTTGPETPAKAFAKPLTSNSTRTSRPGSSSSQPTSAGRSTSKKITKANPLATPAKAEGQFPKRTISKLQAREPTVGNDNSTADLADFFRAGPIGGQVDKTTQSQRPGVVTQRTTSSNGHVNGRISQTVNSGSSVASTQDSFAASKMTQSSTNSRTGLLDSSNRAPPVNAPPVRNNSLRPVHNNDPPGPQRVQRRVLDPYALDSDDENDDGYGTPQPPPEREEESLSDFLRNYTPPAAANATRGAPVSISGAPKPAKQNGPTMRERIARNIAVIPDYRPLPPKAPKKPSASKSPPQSNESRRSAQRQNSGGGFRPPNQNNIARGRSTENAPQLPPINPRATSPHLVSQNGTKMDSYRPTQPTYAKHVDRGPRKQLQAREEHGVLGGPPQGSGMSDLADFLRETEPPAPSGPIGEARPLSPMKEKEESAFGRMFGRRKKEVR